MPSCGIIDPGTLATASRKSSTSAVRIEVSWRQPHRSQPATVRLAPGEEGGRATPPSPDAAAGTPGSPATAPSPAAPPPGTPPLPGTTPPLPGTPLPPGTTPPPDAESWRPEPAGARSSVIRSPSLARLSCGLRGHVRDQTVQRRVGHLADDPCGNPPGPADHQRGGNAGRRDGALEGECYLVTRVVQARVTDLEGPLEGIGRGRAVPDVHPEEPDSARPEVPGEGGKRWCLLAARAAP